MKKLILVFLFPVYLSSAQSEEPIVLTEFLKEIQIWNQQDDKMRLTWWIPTEYWRIALGGNKDIPASTIAQLENVFRDYMLICAADLTIHNDGSMVSREEMDIWKSLVLVDKTGKRHNPLSGAGISTDASTLAKEIKPIFAQVIGPMGKGMHFFFFKGTDEANQRIDDPKVKGEFTVYHSNCEFKWNLPLPTYIPPKFCPVDREKMKGNWNFCPVHGEKLN